MNTMIVVWSIALGVCGLATGVGLIGIVFVWRTRRKTQELSSRILVLMIVITILTFGGTINALFRLIQFLHHP